MNSVIVDCSVVVPCFFPELESARAMRLLYEFKEGLIEWVAPAFLSVEFSNTAWKKNSRRLCDSDEAKKQVLQFIHLPVKYVDSLFLLPQAMELAISYKITVYDALYLSAACATNAVLATFDKRLETAAHASGVKIYPV